LVTRGLLTIYVIHK